MIPNFAIDTRECAFLYTMAKPPPKTSLLTGWGKVTSLLNLKDLASFFIGLKSSEQCDWRDNIPLYDARIVFSKAGWANVTHLQGNAIELITYHRFEDCI